METSMLFALTLSIFLVILLALFPWITQSSAEAERMFRLVKSHREDSRQVSSFERLTRFLAARSRHVRTGIWQRSNKKMMKRFSRAGLRGPHVADLFLWVHGCFVIAGVVAGSFTASSPLFWMGVGGAAGFLIPDLWLTWLQRRRKLRLSRSIPDMVDLMVTCVGAGLGLDQALLRVTEELKLSHPDLGDELSRVLLERGIGATRVDTWRSLAERIGVEEMHGFVTMLVETERFGSPIVAALTQFSDELRTRRRQLAEEAAAKTKIKIIFPLVFCIFPCLCLVLVVPSALTFVHSFGHLGR